jgi:formyl-CoA transferase
MSAAPPLRGITVVSLEHAVVAPFATRQLADLGARVIKIERPGTGDFARRYDETVHGNSSYFVWLNRSKESLARYPRPICCTVTGWGADGPWATRKAYDLLVQCETGLVSLTGTPDGPARTGISVADIAAGMYAYSGVLTALLRRALTGEVGPVEVSLFEALADGGPQLGVIRLLRLHGRALRP